MTRAVTFTQAQVRRAVKAAESAGLRVRKVTINPDGSITVDSGDKSEQRVDDDKEVVL
jgi:hypothetical protein